MRVNVLFLTGGTPHALPSGVVTRPPVTHGDTARREEPTATSATWCLNRTAPRGELQRARNRLRDRAARGARRRRCACTVRPDSPRLGKRPVAMTLGVDVNARPALACGRRSVPVGPTYYFYYYLTLFARGYINALPKPHPPKK